MVLYHKFARRCPIRRSVSAGENLRRLYLSTTGFAADCLPTQSHLLQRTSLLRLQISPGLTHTQSAHLLAEARPKGLEMRRNAAPPLKARPRIARRVRLPQGSRTPSRGGYRLRLEFKLTLLIIAKQRCYAKWLLWVKELNRSAKLMTKGVVIGSCEAFV